MKVDVDQDELIGIHFQFANKSGSVLSMNRNIGRISRKQTSNIQRIHETVNVRGDRETWQEAETRRGKSYI